MFDAVTEPVATLPPEPNRPVPERIGKVLALVHTLVAYGRNLAATLRRHVDDDPQALPCVTFLATIFRTGDFAVIVARIARGLLRAHALAARLERLAARGQDLKPSPIRLPSPGKPRAAKPDTPPADPAEVQSPTPPTIKEVLARDSRRPVGAVLVDICLDLGIVPGQLDRATWDELFRQVIDYGGSLATLVLRRVPISTEFPLPLPEDRAAKPTAAEPIDEEAGRGSDSTTQRTTDPHGSDPGQENGSPVAPQPIVFPEWSAPPPQSPVPACTGPP